MDYRAAVAYMLSFTNYEATPVAYSPLNYDLRRVEELLSPLGNPHLGIRAVHLAGTKGKGSTAAMIASVLSRAGYRSGLYTSPHLHTIRERIRVGDELISEFDFAEIVARIRPEAEEVNRRAHYGLLTTYELLTALAFVYFARKGVAYQVLEVGLGGWLDATNVIEPPQACVITSISRDHTAILGDTLAEIAAQKAGIIKPGGTVVCAPQVAEAARVIEEACRNRGATLIRVGEDVTWHREGGDLGGQRLSVEGERGSYKVSIPLLGDHQVENVATAIAALEVVMGCGARISSGDIARGLAEVCWPGRLQILAQRPWLVVDGAHNGDSVRRLVATIDQYFSYARPILIMGTSYDKDIAEMVAEFSRLRPTVIVTHSRHPRSAEPSMLQEEWHKLNVAAEVTQSVAEAIDRTHALATADDLVLVAGSLFVVAEAIEYAGRASNLSEAT